MRNACQQDSRFLRLPRLLSLAAIAVLALAGCQSDNGTAPGPTPATPSFRALGDLPGGDVHSEALAVSDDGHVVVGRSSSARFTEEGFVWAGADTLTPLLGAGLIPVASEPRALTATGDVVAGKIGIAGGFEAARWTAGTGWVGLGDIAGGTHISQALGISASGSVLVGWGSSDAGFESVRWTAGTPVAMGDLPGGVFNSAAAQVSADGGTISGTGGSAGGPEAYVWTQAGGMVGLGDLAFGAFESEAFGMNGAGTVIVGEGTSAAGVEAFRWTAAGGMEGLGDLPGGPVQSTAFDVSDDGAIVVGFATTGAGSEAFIWDAAHGMRNLKDVLVAAGVTALAGWTLTEATGISADGRTVIGNGTNPSGQAEGWIARWP